MMSRNKQGDLAESLKLRWLKIMLAINSQLKHCIWYHKVYNSSNSSYHLSVGRPGRLLQTIKIKK